MQLRMWTYDLAREQVPTFEHLRAFCSLTRESGYNAIGLYLEHRFAYPSTPWAHGTGAVTPETIRRLQDEFPDLKIVPFINLRGHFEGLLYTEAGRGYAEERFNGMQACPSKPELMELAKRIVADTVAAFDSDIVHIGGDETWQLGACEVCRTRVETYEEMSGVDGKAQLYGEHFGALARAVVEAGRRPAVWGDMFLDHPTALEHMPKETLIFDWQYFKAPSESGKRFMDAGFEVVYCPSIQTYNAAWMHLPESERNIRDHVAAANADAAYGVCVTTWECGLFGNYETLLPAIRSAGRMLSGDGDGGFVHAYLELGENAEEWARIMGTELQEAGGIFAYSGRRSSLKCRLLLYSNPFLLWRFHADELCGEVGERALEIMERAIAFSPDAAYRGVSEFVKLSIEFVRFAEESHRLYALGLPGEATAALIPCRQVFENLVKIAKATNLRIGGSLADVERCYVAQRHVETVIRRIKSYGDGSLGYLPSFETITHPKFMPHDQANWWLINRWGDE